MDSPEAVSSEVKIYTVVSVCVYVLCVHVEGRTSSIFVHILLFLRHGLSLDRELSIPATYLVLDVCATMPSFIYILDLSL